MPPEDSVFYILKCVRFDIGRTSADFLVFVRVRTGDNRQVVLPRERYGRRKASPAFGLELSHQQVTDSP